MAMAEMLKERREANDSMSQEAEHNLWAIAENKPIQHIRRLETDARGSAIEEHVANRSTHMNHMSACLNRGLR